MKWKRVIDFTLILAAALSLTACGNVQGSSNAANTEVESSEVESSEVESSEAESSEVEDSGEEKSEVSETEQTDTSDSEEVTQLPKETPKVYMTDDISSEGLMAVYEAMGWTPEGKVAVKLSTGEPPSSNYLKPELIKDLVQSVDGTIVECNTAYGGSRGETAMHMQVAKDHGFTDIAEVDIMDADGSISLPVNGGIHLEEDLVGAHFANYDSFLVLSHFKGHEMAGFGGAIKNISIGIGSKEGKCLIHTAGKSSTSMWGGVQDDFLESMAEAGKAVSDSLGNGKNIAYINVMNRISIDCDCNGRPAEPDIHDIGILASTDPVALDQACIDLVYTAEGREKLVNRIEQLNGLHTLESAEEIGLGSREYELVNIDD
ncbi:hypothetical protein EDD76_10858 [Kineothrix alysoides]|uniref:DUF362 domain-containing protein n=2 Tax=Kineothrix alysoides TaxID=1469948 RepID=A0A4R1QW22_9FIRM|nr:DUF362 domain-containing protein [Kineothrix alysoides]TCL57523.1 hypothetical protein EDD76_10858 [Kineothrix alysoides]